MIILDSTGSSNLPLSFDSGFTFFRGLSIIKILINESTRVAGTIGRTKRGGDGIRSGLEENFQNSVEKTKKIRNEERDYEAKKKVKKT
jgi:hypothetical protein